MDRTPEEPTATTSPGELVAELRRAGVAEADDGGLSRALYSSDASLYRVPPAAVAWPRHPDEVAAALEVCARLGVPLTVRGAGTSIAGNAVGPGLVLDLGRHLHRVLAIDPEARTATVQPGVVHAGLQRAAAGHGLRFGPDPATHDRCTVGGMIGNNACGSRALAYGRTSDNVLALEVLTGAGERLRLADPDPAASRGPDPGGAPTLEALRQVVRGSLGTIRTELGRFGRQVSGYGLEHLTPERRFDVRRALVGSEGTLALVLQATVRLVADPPHRTLVALGYPDMAAAADAAPGLLAHRPTACEGLDGRIVDAVRRRRGPGAVPPLPRGAGWLFVELAGEQPGELAARARRVVADAGALGALVVDDRAAAAALWRIREDGSGLSSRTPDGRPAHAGWEDAAVPPERLGAYLRDFERLLEAHRLTGAPFGHFGDGCLHIRIDFPLDRPGGPAAFRSFLEEAARLVAGHGGSISGEHGDGRARGELLPLLYSPEAIRLFGAVKAVFDPANLLNPGVVVAPRPVDADLRVPAARPLRAGLALTYRHDRGDFSTAVHRCTGVGRCVADTTAAGGVMCPSWLATRDEKDSTRGRARVLQEMVNGSLVGGGWRAPAVHQALELCLACKACANDCPTGVDMAAYKAEALWQRYRGRVRPRSHYSLGWLPRWAGLAAGSPRLANAATAMPGLAAAGRWAAGVDRRRGLPRFAATTFRRWFRATAASRATEGRPVLLWVDTFTDHFGPEVGVAAVRVLERAGYRVAIPDRRLCCGLTFVSTGQLAAARRRLRRAVGALGPAVRAGVPVVGLEPSCTAVLRADLLELVGGAEAEAVAAGTRTLAELLAATPGWTPPSLDGVEVLAQPHCHHHAVMGWAADAELLTRAGARVRRLGGCCGLAGNFGMERGHYEVSVAVAEHTLLPAVRAATPGTVLLADGFSCRMQLDDLAARRGRHLAELLAAHLP